MSTETERLLQQIVDASDPFANARKAAEYESAMATSAVAALVIRPAVLSAVTIINREPSGKKSLVIDRIFTHNLVTTAVNGFFQMWYCLHPVDVVVIAVKSIIALRGSGDTSGPNTNAVIVEVGRTVVDDGWFPAGSTGEVSSTGTTPRSRRC